MSTSETARFTRDDYERLPEGFPAVLLDGGLVREAAPTWRHQAVVLAIATRLQETAPRRVLVAPVDVVIDEWNVLQPDVLVATPEVGSAADGTPDDTPLLVVEVLSPATADRDRGPKTRLYLQAGVAEVWLVDPAARSIEVVTRDGIRHHGANDRVVSTAVPGLRMAWSDVAP